MVEDAKPNETERHSERIANYEVSGEGCSHKLDNTEPGHSINEARPRRVDNPADCGKVSRDPRSSQRIAVASHAAESQMDKDEAIRILDSLAPFFTEDDGRATLVGKRRDDDFM